MFKLKITFLISLLILLRCRITISQRIIFGTPPQSNSCGTAEDTLGLCVEIWRCSSVKNNVAFRPPKHCGFKGTIPFVCCPLSEIISHIRSQDEVAAPTVNFDCGTRVIKRNFVLGKRRKRQVTTNDQTFRENLQPSISTTEPPVPPEFLPPEEHPPMFEIPNPDDSEPIFQGVVGAVVAVRNSWPWMVLLWRQQGPRKSFFCGGTLINPRFVVTAAHCVLSFEPFFARLGEHDHTESTDIREDVEVIAVIFHPDYDINFGYYDIALLELAKDVTIKEEVRPICLPWGKKIKKSLIDQIVTIAGWGKDGFGSSGSPSPVLLVVNLTIFETEVCRRSYSELPDYSKTFPNGMTAHNILCAGDVDGGKDTCEGDSGGPLMLRDSTKTFSLVGVISKGVGCGDKKFPGLNAPVANIDTLQWIKDVAFSEFSF